MPLVAVATTAKPARGRSRWRLLSDVLGLQTPFGRLIFFGVVTILVFLAPYNWLAHLSIWQALGIPAPSIGLTRAYHLLLHGDPMAAWHRNRLIYLVLAIGLPLLIKDVFVLMKRRRATK